MRLCQGFKEIDLIWVILKKSNSWGEKKEERKLDTLRKRYLRTANTNPLLTKHITLHLTSVFLPGTTKTQDYISESSHFVEMW